MKLWVTREKRNINKIQERNTEYIAQVIFYAFLFCFLFEHLLWCGRLIWILPFSEVKARRLPKTQSCYTFPVPLKCMPLGSVVIYFFFNLLTHWAFCQDILKVGKEKLGLAWPLLPSWKDPFIDSNCGIEHFYLVKPLLPFDTGDLSCVNHPSGCDKTKKKNWILDFILQSYELLNHFSL